jgi:hypothetical protein
VVVVSGNLAWRLILACAVDGLALACGQALPRPPTGPHPETAREDVEVPYPPPPARGEIVPPRPESTESAVWLDGSWTWLAGRWVWEPGGWVTQPPRAYLARWTLLRSPDGRLYFLPNAWYQARSNTSLPAPAIIVGAADTLGELETGELGQDAGVRR